MPDSPGEHADESAGDEPNERQRSDVVDPAPLELLGGRAAVLVQERRDDEPSKSSEAEPRDDPDNDAHGPASFARNLPAVNPPSDPRRPMARGGLSQDPAIRERQLSALAAGRRIAQERRAAGLPTKRRGSRQSPATEAGETGSRGSGKVVPGTYDDNPGKKATATRKPAAAPPPANDPPDPPSLSRLERAYAAVLGWSVDG
jgi:hypothetical protein